MTRFLLALDDAVDIIFAAIGEARHGETLVPACSFGHALPMSLQRSSATSPIHQVDATGIRPGEKIHEIMVSDEEAYRTVRRGRWYVIRPMLPEVANGRRSAKPAACLKAEYSSNDSVMNLDETTAIAAERSVLMLEDNAGRVELLDDPPRIGSWTIVGPAFRSRRRALTGPSMGASASGRRFLGKSERLSK